MRVFMVLAALTLATGAVSAQAPTKLPPKLLEAVATYLPGVEPDQIAPAPVEGMYEVKIGPTIIYLSSDGRYMLRGDIVDLAARRNLTEGARRLARAEAVEALGEPSMIVFSPAKVRHTVTVFTDIDCPYCARLHQQMAGYNELGIKVRYTAFPRAGIPSRSYDKTVSVWCAEDRGTAIGAAKRGEPIEARKCDNPVERHFDLGRAIGVTGTPSIVLQSGQMIPGYVPPHELAKILTEREPG